jgi:hypothetical protein
MFFSFVAGKSCNTCETYTVLAWRRVCGDFTKHCFVVMAWLLCVCVCVCVRVYAHVCVCVCTRVRVWEREARFLVSSGHWAERGKACHVSVCNDILDNAFCVHSNKMLKLNSTMVPAVSKNTHGRQQCKGKDDRRLYSTNTSVHLVALFCFWLSELTRWWRITKLCYIVCCEEYRWKNVREYLLIAYIWWRGDL